MQNSIVATMEVKVVFWKHIVAAMTTLQWKLLPKIHFYIFSFFIVDDFKFHYSILSLIGWQYNMAPEVTKCNFVSIKIECLHHCGTWQLSSKFSLEDKVIPNTFTNKVIVSLQLMTNKNRTNARLWQLTVCDSWKPFNYRY